MKDDYMSSMHYAVESGRIVSYCEVDKCNAVIALKEQLKSKEQECEKWRQIANEYEQRWLNSYGV